MNEFNIGDEVRIKRVFDYRGAVREVLSEYIGCSGVITKIIPLTENGKEIIYHEINSVPQIWKGEELELLNDFSLTEKEVMNVFQRRTIK